MHRVLRLAARAPRLTRAAPRRTSSGAQAMPKRAAAAASAADEGKPPAKSPAKKPKAAKPKPKAEKVRHARPRAIVRVICACVLRQRGVQAHSALPRAPVIIRRHLDVHATGYLPTARRSPSYRISPEHRNSPARHVFNRCSRRCAER